MRLFDFMSAPEYQLPLERPTDDFQGFVESVLGQFEHRIDHIDTPDSVASKIGSERTQLAAFCQGAKEVTRLALSGDTSDAYQKFSEIMSHIMPHVERHTVEGFDPSNLRFMYRVRPQITPAFTREELFHIAFENRHKVATQRYSIPGIPCLYLSGSIYTCWAEMGRPAFHELQASEFWINPSERIKLLDLTERPSRFLRFYFNPDGEIQGSTGPEGSEEKLVTHVMLWPLTALCSIIVRHKSASFKSEYIFPQLLLHWLVRSHHYDGIAYSSTHVKQSTTSPLATCNFVFPAKKIGAKGRCPELRRLFKMTEPQSWQLLRAINAGTGTTGAAFPNHQFEFIEGHQEAYGYSEFGLVETKLNKIALNIQVANVKGQPELGDVAE